MASEPQTPTTTVSNFGAPDNDPQPIAFRRQRTILLGMAALVVGLMVIAGFLLQPSDLIAQSFVFEPWILVTIAALAIVLAGLTIWVVRTVIHSRRAQGSNRLLMRILFLFGFIAVAPTLVLGVAAALFFSFGVSVWFGEPVRTALNESLAISQAYLDEHRNTVRTDALEIAFDLEFQRDTLLLIGSRRFNGYLETQAIVHGLSEVFLIRRDRSVVARGGSTVFFDLVSPDVPDWAFDEVGSGEAYNSAFS